LPLARRCARPREAQAFDLLRYLVEHADRLVTQDPRSSRPCGRHLRQPGVVKKYVLEVRKALGDRPGARHSSRRFRGAGTGSSRRYGTAPFPDRPARPGRARGSWSGAPHRERAWSAVLTRRSRASRQVIFVTGEAGVGKTTSRRSSTSTSPAARRCGSRGDSAWRVSAGRKRTIRSSSTRPADARTGQGPRRPDPGRARADVAGPVSLRS